MTSPTALRDERHPAFTVPYKERRRQVWQANTLPRQDLREYLMGQEMVEVVWSIGAQTRLAASPHQEIRRRLAHHPHLVAHLQPALAEDPDPNVRRALSQNFALVPEAARIILRAIPLKREDYHGVAELKALAANPSSPLDVLREIRRLIRSPKTPSIYTSAMSGLLVNPGMPLSEHGPLELLSRANQYQASCHPDILPEEMRQLQVAHVKSSALHEHLPDWDLVVVHHQNSFPGTVGELEDLLESQVRPMDPAQRETFDRLLFEWDGTLEELVTAAPLLLTSL